MGGRTGQSLERLLSITTSSYGPGLFLLVHEGADVIFAGSAGTADVDHPRQIAVEDHFRVGSVTKPFVAALILLLVESGVLSLRDTAGALLPGLLPTGADVTVEHLLRMQSGIPDYVPALLGTPPDPTVYTREWNPEDLVQIALQLDTFLQPGGQHRYSNTDYILLGLIAQLVSEATLDEALRRWIFDPLGLAETSLPTTDRTLPTPHAQGYVRLDGDSGYVDFTVCSPSESWASGAIVSTPRDLAAFLSAVLHHKLLRPESLRRMTDFRPTGTGREYGMGLQRHTLSNGRICVGHTGGTPGFNTVAMASPAGRVAILYRNALDVANPLPVDLPVIRTCLRA